MSTQPATLRLADQLDADATINDMGRKPNPKCHKRQAAAELRRLDAELERKSDAIQRLWKERDDLRAVNAQLLQALKYVLEDDELIPRATSKTRAVVCAAIAKATGDKE